MTPEEISQKITEFLSKGQKLQAVQWVINNTNWGLRQAKDLVDAVELSFAKEKLNSFAGDDLKSAVKRLLEKNQKIEAVKLVKETLDIGLKEAKDFVDEMEAS